MSRGQRAREFTLVAAVVALITLASLPAIRVALGSSGDPLFPDLGTALFPPGCTPGSVAGTMTVNKPVTVPGAGVALSWHSYCDGFNDSDHGLADYEVYRDTSPVTPQDQQIRIATVPPNITSFTDRSVSAGDGKGPYYYEVDARTNSGDLITSQPQIAELPSPGQTEFTIEPRAAVTLTKGYPVSTQEMTVSSAGSDQVLKRGVMQFGPLTALPGGAVVTSARLKAQCRGDDVTHLLAYPLTRTFNPFSATWQNAASGSAWHQPGGDFAAPSAADIPQPPDESGSPVCEFDVTAAVRSWTTSRTSAHGLLLKFDNETPPAGQASPGTGEPYVSVSDPELTISYKPGT